MLVYDVGYKWFYMVLLFSRGNISRSCFRYIRVMVDEIFIDWEIDDEGNYDDED